MNLAELTILVTHHMLMLLAVVNPLGNIPVYAELTAGFERSKRNQIMNMAVLTSLCMVVLFALVGDWCLTYLFGVTLMELRIAGGILLFVVALRGVVGDKTSHPKSEDYRMVAVFPLAFPIMVGPGALTVTIIMAQGSGPWRMTATAVLTFMIVFLIARHSHSLMRFLGPYAGKIISRLLYIFLAAKAVSMVLVGLGEFLRQVLAPLVK